MPWLTIAVWIISYLLSYSKTKDVGKSALIATGAAAAAYYTVEPTNETAIWGDATRDWFGYGAVSPDTVPTTGESAATRTTPSNGWDLGVKAIDETGSTLRSWGPQGTAGVVATTSLASDGTLAKYFPWILVAGAFILISR